MPWLWPRHWRLLQSEAVAEQAMPGKGRGVLGWVPGALLCRCWVSKGLLLDDVLK